MPKSPSLLDAADFYFEPDADDWDELEKEEREDPKKRRELAADSVLYFDVEYCEMEYARHRERWLTQLQDEYEAARATLDTPEPTKAKAVFIAPRGHGKTEAVITLATWAVCLDRDIRVLIVCESGPVAEKRLQRVKALLLSDRIQADWCSAPDEGFGPFLPETKEERKALTKWGTNKVQVLRGANFVDPTIEAVGMTGAITGGHFDLILVDDPQNYEDVGSPTMREKHRTWFMSTLTPMLNPGGFMVVIGTRKHHDDLYEHLLKNPTFRVLGSSPNGGDQAIVKWPDMTRTHPIYGYDEHGREIILDWHIEGDYEVLWPERRPLKFLLTEREGMATEEGLGYTNFEREYQGNVRSDEHAHFRLEWLKDACEAGKDLKIHRGPWPRRLLIIQGVDPAFVTDEKHAEQANTDWQVVATWAADVVTRRRYLLDVELRRGGSPRTKALQIVQEYSYWAPPPGTVEGSIIDYIRNGWCFGVHMEKNSAGAFLATEVDGLEDLPLVAYWTGPEVKDPFVGVPALAALFERRKVVFPHGDAETKGKIREVVDQFHQLGAGAKKDAVMAIWLAETLLRKALVALDIYLEDENIDLREVLPMAA